MPNNFRALISIKPFNKQFLSFYQVSFKSNILWKQFGISQRYYRNLLSFKNLSLNSYSKMKLELDCA